MSRLLVPLTVLAAAAAVAAAAPRQDPAPPPLPEGVVAILDGREITLAEYQDFLWRQNGKRMLPQMADEILVHRACERFGVAPDEAGLAARVDERLSQLTQGRRPEDFEQEMRSRGLDLETLRRSVRSEYERTMRLDGLVRATRIATDERLRAAFDTAYGPGGVKLELRQVLSMPHVLRAERIRAGADPAGLDEQALRDEARERAREARRRIIAGEEFAAVAREFSHDQGTREQGGVLAYRPGLYGETFGAAVQALQPGEVSELIESAAGFHVVQVAARTVTEFSRVREELVKTVMEAEPSWQERESVLQSLRAAADLRLW